MKEVTVTVCYKCDMCHKEYKPTSIRNKFCDECKIIKRKAASRKYYLKSSYDPDKTAQIKSFRRNRFIANKERALSILGRKCSECGYDINMAALLFINKKHNNFRIISALMSQWSDELENKLLDVKLLCANCDRISKNF